MKNNNGWITILLCGSFSFTAIGYGYTTMAMKELRSEHREDVQLISQKFDKMYDRVSEMDKKVTQTKMLTKLILKDAYGIKRNE